MKRLLLATVVSVMVFHIDVLETSCHDNETYISEEIQEVCSEIAEEYGICEELILSIIEHESSGNPEAVSANCKGLMQVDPRWHGERMKRLGVTDLFDPAQNILTGVDYLAELAGEYGDLYLVLMIYNMGPDRAQELWEQENYSNYALSVSARSAQLERARGK